jgi:hypothetical protein
VRLANGGPPHRFPAVMRDQAGDADSMQNGSPIALDRRASRS